MANLNDIALFVEVASAGTFASAARRLGMPSNTLSRRIQDLEVRLGVRLIERSMRKLVLTDVGRRLYDHCSDQIDDMVQYVRDLSQSAAKPHGRIHIATPVDFFEEFRIEWVVEFLALYPAIKLNFLLDDARIDLIANGVDLAFRGGDTHEPNFVARRIGTTRRLLVASPSYIDARGRPESFLDLSDHERLMFAAPGDRPRWNLNGPDGAVETEIDGCFSANTLRSVFDATMAGLGIGLLPSFWVQPHIASGRLQVVLPEYSSQDITYYWVYTSRKQQPRAARAFMEFAERKLAANWVLESGQDQRQA